MVEIFIHISSCVSTSNVSGDLPDGINLCMTKDREAYDNVGHLWYRLDVSLSVVGLITCPKVHFCFILVKLRPYELRVHNDSLC